MSGGTRKPAGSVAGPVPCGTGTVWFPVIPRATPGAVAALGDHFSGTRGTSVRCQHPPCGALGQSRSQPPPPSTAQCPQSCQVQDKTMHKRLECPKRVEIVQAGQEAFCPCFWGHPPLSRRQGHPGGAAPVPRGQSSSAERPAATHPAKARGGGCERPTLILELIPSRARGSWAAERTDLAAVLSKERTSHLMSRFTKGRPRFPQPVTSAPVLAWGGL